MTARLDLAAIRERCEKATEGPWDLNLTFHSMHQAIIAPAGDAELGTWMVAERVRWDDDARFIAHARTDLPALLAMAERMQREIEQYKTLLADPVAVRVALLRGDMARPTDLIFMHDTDGPYAKQAATITRLTEALRARRYWSGTPDICSICGKEIGAGQEYESDNVLGIRHVWANRCGPALSAAVQSAEEMKQPTSEKPNE